MALLLAAGRYRDPAGQTSLKKSAFRWLPASAASAKFVTTTSETDLGSGAPAKFMIPVPFFDFEVPERAYRKNAAGNFTSAALAQQSVPLYW
jgi:hypothetical protein